MRREWECEECFHVHMAATALPRCPDCGAVRTFWLVEDDDGNGWDDYSFGEDDLEEEEPGHSLMRPT